MANNIVEKVIVAINNKISNRPDGLEIDRYKDINKWTYRRWAWEFLRRNAEFISECERVQSGTIKEKQDVAQVFGLIKFKSYKEGYTRKSGIPKFSLGSISSWSNLDDNKSESKVVKISMENGQMVIRFDLASAIKDEKVLDRQLFKAEVLVRSRMAKYKKIIQKKSEVHRHKAIAFGIYIRLLDYLASGKKDYECAALIYPEKVKTDGLVKEEMRDLVKNQIKSAKNYAQEKYIYLSLLEGKPKGKEITVER